MTDKLLELNRIVVSFSHGCGHIIQVEDRFFVVKFAKIELIFSVDNIPAGLQFISDDGKRYLTIQSKGSKSNVQRV